MSFKSKQDYYGLSAKAANLVLTSTTENRSASVAEAKGENGFTVATQMYGEKSAPSCEYAVKGDVALSDVKIGTVTTIDSRSFVLASLSVSTSAGAAPTVSASGQQVEDGATAACTCTLPAISVEGLHHAQNFGAFAISGAGAHLTQSSLTVTGTVSTAEKDGETIAHDVTDVRLEVSGTIQVSDSTYAAPAVTLSDGWVLTAPLSETNPDGDFPTYTFTATKFLAADAS
jgi:hypothetical protein